MSVPFRPSATRIDKACAEGPDGKPGKGCLRRWALDELYGEGREETEALTLGTELHEQQARYLRDGASYDMTMERDTGRLALAAIHLLPRPRDPNVLVETSFVGNLFGLTWQGTTDMRWRDRPAVWDHKTTTDFRYAKTPEILPNDIQCALYAHQEMSERGSSWCHVRWIYYRKKRKPYKAFASETIVTYEQILPTLKRAHRTLLRMYQVSEERTPALFLEPNAHACHAFNRQCPHISRCNLPGSEHWKAFVAEYDENDFLNRIGANATLAQKAQIAAPPSPEPPKENPNMTQSAPNTWQQINGKWIDVADTSPANQALAAELGVQLMGAPQPQPQPSMNPPQWSPAPVAQTPAGPPSLGPGGQPRSPAEIVSCGFFPGIVFHPAADSTASHFHHAAAPPNTWTEINPHGVLTFDQVRAAPGCPAPATPPAGPPQNGPPPFGAASGPVNAGPPAFGGAPGPTPPVDSPKKARKDALEKAEDLCFKALEQIKKARAAEEK